MSYILNTDGGARGNPGPSGAGAVVRDESGTIVARVSKYLGHATNNVAEYEALLLALDAVTRLVPEGVRGDTDLIINMDSELIVKQMQGVYKVKHPVLAEKNRAVRARLAPFQSALFVHVLRAKNAEADALANAAMDKGA